MRIRSVIDPLWNLRTGSSRSRKCYYVYMTAPLRVAHPAEKAFPHSKFR
jgi:hypothetical protein